jgi:tetratricopeptide (TPR) repeat protein
MERSKNVGTWYAGRDWIAAGLLAALTFVAFARALDAGFVNFDDADYVTANLNVTEGLSPARIVWAFTTLHNANWHPLTWLSLQLDASLWGRDARGFHLTNVLLHCANAALAFLALRALTGCFWESCAVALLFAVHPLRAESVAWVSERKDVLSVLFGLLALYGYARYVQRPTFRRYLGVAVPFALSLMSKPTLVTLPFLLLVLDWWPLARWPTRGTWPLVREKLPLFGLTVASAALTFVAQRMGGAVGDLKTFPLAMRLENAAVSYVGYLLQTVWPVNLCPFYTHPGQQDHPGDYLPVWKVAGAVLLLVAMTTAAVLSRRRAPYLLAGWLWYVGTLVPVIGIVQVGNQAMADRYTYFPQIGVLIALCWGAASLLRPWPRAALALPAVAAVALMALNWRQVSYWHDSVTLWHHALEVNDSSPLNMLQYASAIEDQGFLDDAAQFYRKILEADSQSPQARSNLANILSEQGHQDEAERLLREALRIDPNYALAHTNLGHVLYRQGHVAEAIREHDKALALAPHLKGAYCNLAMAEASLGHVDSAIEHYRQALRLEPDFANAHSGLGNLLIRQGHESEGMAHLQRAVQCDPRFAEGHNNLGKALAARGDFNGAAKQFEEATRLDPRMAVAWYNLGAARAPLLRLDEAVDCMLKALELEPASANFRGGLEKLQDLLKKYGRPDLVERIQHQLDRPAVNSTTNGSAGLAP